MNILAGIVAIVFILYCVEGIRKGLVDGLVHIVSNILGLIVIVVIAKGVGNFLQGSYLNVIIALILLFAISIINKVLKLILDSLKIASKLPVVSWVNHLVGIVLGFVRALMFVWFVFILFGYIQVPVISDWIMTQVSQSEFLTVIYKTNLFVPFLLSLQ